MPTLKRRTGTVLAGAALVFLIAAVLWLSASVLGRVAPAVGIYPITIAPGIQPFLTSQRAAGIARGYLDEQTPQLAAPELHETPMVLAEWATPARDAGQWEPRIPLDAIAQEPARIVWVVSVSGDLLNLSDWPWSRSGAPDPSGSIVIDDASGMILGVYPYDPPYSNPAEPASP